MLRIVLLSLGLALVSSGCGDDDDTMADECSLEPESGPCEADFTRYYYDPGTGQCEPFSWGGCEGVVPFETLEDCQAACE